MVGHARGKTTEIDSVVTEREPPNRLRWHHEAERVDGRPGSVVFARDASAEVTIVGDATGSLVTYRLEAEPGSLRNAFMLRVLAPRPIRQSLAIRSLTVPHILLEAGAGPRCAVARHGDRGVPRGRGARRRAGGRLDRVPCLRLNSDLPNSHDAVGRRLTTHLQDIVTGFFERELHPDVGQVTMARADFPGVRHDVHPGVRPAVVRGGDLGSGQRFRDRPDPEAPWDTQGPFWARKPNAASASTRARSR